MKLTRTERWILSNQYQILAALDAENAEHFHECREILERGYELEYDEIAADVYDAADTMSEQECREVIDILNMFSDLKTSFDKLGHRSGIEKREVVFPRFHANTETKWLCYTRYVAASFGADASMFARGDLESPGPVLDSYRRILTEWRNAPQRPALSKDDVIRITGARR